MPKMSSGDDALRSVAGVWDVICRDESSGDDSDSKEDDNVVDVDYEEVEEEK